MINLAKWQQIRRVDHLPLLVGNPRFRSRPEKAPDLKVFDADVAAYGNTNNNFDLVTILGRIIQEAKSQLDNLKDYDNSEVPKRYRQAISELSREAEADMNRICSPNYGATRTPELVSLSDSLQKTPKQVRVNVIYLTPVGGAPPAGPPDATINQHLTLGNNIYQSAGITIVRTNPTAQAVSQTAAGQSILLPNANDIPADKRGKFAAGGTSSQRLIEYCNQLGHDQTTIDVVYVPAYDEDDAQGKTYRAGVEYAGAVPKRPIVTVTLAPPSAGAATYTSTLAHELGHAITGEASHSADQKDLMAAGSHRTTDNTISDGNIVWLRNNLYARTI